MEVIFFIVGVVFLLILLTIIVKKVDSIENESKSQNKKNYTTSKNLSFKILQSINTKASQFEKITRKMADIAEQSRIELQKNNKAENYRKTLKIVTAKDHYERHLESLENIAQCYFIGLDSKALLDIHNLLFDFENEITFEFIFHTETYKEEKTKFLKKIEKNEEILEPIKNFIAIRYYLTGDVEYPKISTLNDYFDNKIPESYPIFYKLIWEFCLKKLDLDETKVKNINSLYHFTHKNNLNNILKMGLITKANLKKLKIDYIENDQNRWDGIEDSLSLSISHPNHKMFMKYAKPTGIENWVILKISPELLTGNFNCKELKNFCYLDKAIFNKLNAASFLMKNLSIKERKSYKIFLDMFESNRGMTLETHTFDNQAEILYQSDIPKEFIKEVCIIEEDESLSWVHELGFKININKALFEKR